MKHPKIDQGVVKSPLQSMPLQGEVGDGKISEREGQDQYSKEPRIIEEEKERVVVARGGRNWERQELLLFFHYIEENRSSFADEKARKCSKIYKNMSSFIGSRNINQCRSYSQKMVKKFGSIDNVRSFLKEVLVPEEKEEIVQSKSEQNYKFSKKAQNKIWEGENHDLALWSKYLIPELSQSFIDEKGDKDDVKPTDVDYEAYLKRHDPAGSFRHDQQDPVKTKTSVNNKIRNSILCSEYFNQDRCDEESVDEGLEANLADRELGGVCRCGGKPDLGEQWFKCQDLFLQWRNRLEKLMENRRRQHDYSY